MTGDTIIMATLTPDDPKPVHDFGVITVMDTHNVIAWKYSNIVSGYEREREMLAPSIFPSQDHNLL